MALPADGTVVMGINVNNGNTVALALPATDPTLRPVPVHPDIGPLTLLNVTDWLESQGISGSMSLMKPILLIWHQCLTPMI